MPGKDSMTLLRSKPSPNSGARNTRHYNLPQPGGDVHRYDIGGEAVEVPDVDAAIILKLSPHEIERVS